MTHHCHNVMTHHESISHHTPEYQLTQYSFCIWHIWSMMAMSSLSSYIAFKGECNKVVRRTVITIAETAANPADHETKAAATKHSHQFGY